MDKNAQKMRLSKLREKLSPTGHLEEFFKPEFKEVMENLRKGDDTIRSIVAGEKLGDGDPGQFQISLKDLLKSARSNTNRREYMTALSDISRFHAKLREISKALGEINASLDKVHHQFLFQDLKDEHIPHLEDLENRWKAASAARQAEFIKKAGLMDMWHNLTDERGKSLRAWEKKYPNKTKDLKRGLTTLLDLGERTKDNILATLKDLAHLRATRKPEEYMALAKSNKGLLGAYNTFDKTFQSLYNGSANGGFSLKQLVQDLKQFKAVPVKETKEMGDQSVPVDKEKFKIKTDIGPDIKTDVTVPPAHTKPSHLSMPPMPGAPGKPRLELVHEEDDNRPTDKRLGAVPMEDPYLPYLETYPVAAPANPQEAAMDALNKLDQRYTVAPPAPYARQQGLDAINRLDNRHLVPPAGSGVVPNPGSRSAMLSPSPVPVPPTPSELEELGGNRAAEVARQIQMGAHASFFTSLQKMGSESPLLLASYISKYAKKIQQSDPATSIQLLKIVKRIKG